MVPALQITVPDKARANLLVLLLEEILTPYIANPLFARVVDTTGAVIAVSGGTSKATVRFGGGEVRLENGLADDAWLRVDGDVDSLLAVATRDDLIRPFLTGRVQVRPQLAAATAIPRRLAGRAGATP